MSVGFSPLFSEKRVRKSWQRPCMQAWHWSLSPNVLLPLRTTGKEEPHTVQCGLRRTRPATKLETRALTERVESCSHTGRSVCTALWLSLGRTLIDCHLLERTLFTDKCWGHGVWYISCQFPLYWTAYACIERRSNKRLIQHWPDFQDGKKQMSALATYI